MDCGNGNSNGITFDNHNSRNDDNKKRLDQALISLKARKNEMEKAERAYRQAKEAYERAVQLVSTETQSFIQAISVVSPSPLRNRTCADEIPVQIRCEGIEHIGQTEECPPPPPPPPIAASLPPSSAANKEVPDEQLTITFFDNMPAFNQFHEVLSDISEHSDCSSINSNQKDNRAAVAENIIGSPTMISAAKKGKRKKALLPSSARKRKPVAFGSSRSSTEPCSRSTIVEKQKQTIHLFMSSCSSSESPAEEGDSTVLLEQKFNEEQNDDECGSSIGTHPSRTSKKLAYHTTNSNPCSKQISVKKSIMELQDDDRSRSSCSGADPAENDHIKDDPCNGLSCSFFLSNKQQDNEPIDLTGDEEEIAQPQQEELINLNEETATTTANSTEETVDVDSSSSAGKQGTTTNDITSPLNHRGTSTDNCNDDDVDVDDDDDVPASSTRNAQSNDDDAASFVTTTTTRQERQSSDTTASCSRPSWIDDFQTFLETVPHGDRNRTIRKSSAHAFAKKIAMLATGQGIRCNSWPPDVVFGEGFKISNLLEVDLDSLIEEAKLYNNNFRDKGKGKGFINPMQKLVVYQRYLRDSG